MAPAVGSATCGLRGGRTGEAAPASVRELGCVGPWVVSCDGAGPEASMERFVRSNGRLCAVACFVCEMFRGSVWVRGLGSGVVACVGSCFCWCGLISGVAVVIVRKAGVMEGIVLVVVKWG